jgi:hypothetical protein
MAFGNALAVEFPLLLEFLGVLPVAAVWIGMPNRINCDFAYLARQAPAERDGNCSPKRRQINCPEPEADRANQVTFCHK